MPPRQQKRKYIPKVVKDLTWAKWIGNDIATAKCLCCAVNDIRMNSFHCGHVVAEADGGPTTVDNLRPICATCNLSMRTQNMNLFKEKHALGPGKNSLMVEDGHIRASTMIGSTAVSVSVPISTVVQTVRGLFA